MTVEIIYPTLATSGWIDFDLLNYNAHANDDPQIYGYIGLAGYFISRGYFSFDTSMIPAHAIISSARIDILYYNQTVGGAGLPNTWRHEVYMGGDVIGANLTVADWGSAGFIFDGNITPANGIVGLDLSAAAIARISRTGTTDFEIRDRSAAAGVGGWSIEAYRNTGARFSTLTITYDLPEIKNCILKNCQIKG